MAYFQHNEQEPQHRRAFWAPEDDAQEEHYLYDDEDDGEDPAQGEDAFFADDEYDVMDDDDMTEEERALAQRDHWQMLAGIGDFLAVILGTAVILVLVALLVSLINWVHADLMQSFTLWQTKI